MVVGSTVDADGSVYVVVVDGNSAVPAVVLIVFVTIIIAGNFGKH